MKEALRDVATKTCEVAKPSAGELVLDIGCNDGTLLRSYETRGLRLIGFEPAQNLVEDARKGTEYVFNDFFTAEAFREKFPTSNAKIVTSIAMFYDLDKPSDFVADVVECLDTHGVWVVQQNYLCSMLEQNGFDNIGHEHLTYYSLKTMNQLLSRHDMEIFHVETNDVNGGSFRTYIARRGEFLVRDSVRKLHQYETDLFSRKPSIYDMFAKNVQEIRIRLRSFIDTEVKRERTVYVYGASTRGNTVLQYCELDHRVIMKAADANPEKWGLVTPGTGIPIVSKEEARRDHPDYFIILPHHFLKEITRDEEAYLNADGRFIVPLPTPRIVTKYGTSDI